MSDRSQFLAECQRLVPLGPWLALCEQARVPHIPATFSEPFPVDEIGNLLDGEGDTRCIRAAIQWLMAEMDLRRNRAEEVMWRWECCASSEVKLARTKGIIPTWGSRYAAISVDDERVFDCTVGQTTRLCVRPWKEPVMVGRCPLEFRAFFGPDGFLGISSYYPQRPLSADDRNIPYFVGKVAEGAARLWSAGQFPFGCSMDFLVPETAASYPEQVLFLEGGPPHHLSFGPSAHPCCFAPGRIDGVALAPQPGALTEEEAAF